MRQVKFARKMRDLYIDRACFGFFYASMMCQVRACPVCVRLLCEGKAQSCVCMADESHMASSCAVCEVSGLMLCVCVCVCVCVSMC